MITLVIFTITQQCDRLWRALEKTIMDYLDSPVWVLLLVDDCPQVRQAQQLTRLQPDHQYCTMFHIQAHSFRFTMDSHGH